MALPNDDAQTIRSLRDLVGQVTDESLKNRLEKKVDDMESTMTDKEVTSADKDAKVARLEASTRDSTESHVLPPRGSRSTHSLSRRLFNKVGRG